MLCSVVPNIRGLPVKMLKGPSEGQVVGKIEDLGGQLYVEKHSKLDTMKTSVLGSLEFALRGTKVGVRFINWPLLITP